MTLLLFLHVLAMFIAFAFTAGIGIFLSVLTGTNDVRAMRTGLRIARPLILWGSVILLAGVVFGFGTASAAGFPLTSRWLVVTYVLVALIVVIGVLIHRPWASRLARAAEASSESAPSAELTAVMREPAARIAGPLSGLLWIGVLAMMIWKP